MMASTTSPVRVPGNAAIDLPAFQVALGYLFEDQDLLQQALTHRSFANEQGLPGGDYERLEFLGDAVLGMVTADWLFQRFPERPEGELSKLKSFLVSARSLARYGRGLGLGDLLRLGVGEGRSGGRRKDSLLANSLEAVFGAIYLDGGLDPARQRIETFLDEAFERHGRLATTDSKTELQEVVQAQGQALPSYLLVAQDGPDHAKEFTVECTLADGRSARGTGRSKKVAEQVAAAALLESLGGGGAD